MYIRNRYDKDGNLIPDPKQYVPTPPPELIEILMQSVRKNKEKHA